LSRESILSTHDKNIQNSFTGQNPAPSVSDSPLLTLDAFELQHDPQRGRDLSHILLAFSGAFEQAGKGIRRSPSVASSVTSGMMIGRGNGRDQFGAGRGQTSRKTQRY
jgi:hypothetical protein